MFIRKKLVLLVLGFLNVLLVYKLLFFETDKLAEEKLYFSKSHINKFIRNSFSSEEAKHSIFEEKNHIQPKKLLSKNQDKQSTQKNNQNSLKSNVRNNNSSTSNKKADKFKNCPIFWDEKWLDKNMDSAELKPLINLDKSKFLLPVPTNGPNNQLVGTRESLYVAIRLNRTLVVPQLFKHRTDDQLETSKLIHPGHRIDLETLRKFVPCVTIDYFRDVCKGRIDAVFRVRKMTINKYRKIEDNLNMTILKRIKGTNEVDRTNPFTAIYQYPMNENLNRKLKYFDILPDTSSIEKLYSSKEACVIHPSLFRNLKIKERRPHDEEPDAINLQEISNTNLYSEIIRFTKSPKHIVAMAEDFIRNVLKHRPYLSVHWRFDRQDWMRRCLAPNPWGTERRLEMCRTILSFKPTSIARVISDRTHNISDSTVAVEDVYLAYPLIEKDVIENVTKLLRNKFNLKVFTHADVLEYWEKKYSSCDWIWPDHLDILSTTEMEICVKGKSFLHSVQSTWSKNVCLSRQQGLEDRYDCADEKDITFYVKMFQNTLK